MKTTLVKLALGLLVPAVFLCDSKPQKAKQSKSIVHEKMIAQIVETHKRSKRK